MQPFRVLALCLLLLAGPLAAQGLAPLRLDAATSIQPLAPHLRWLRDGPGTLELQGALAALERGDFTPLGKRKSNFGYIDGALWFQFDVEAAADAPADWLFVIEYSLVDHIQLYRIDADGGTHNWRGGDREVFSSRSADLRYFNWRQRIEPGQRVRYLLRAESESSMQLPMLWARPGEYLERSQNALLGLGAYFGVLIALATYNLILFLSVRDRNFLYYVLYVTSVGWMLLCLTGLAFQHLWPQQPDWANLAVLLSMSASLASMLHFTRRFLDLRTHLPWGERLTWGLILLSASLAIAALFLPYAWVVRTLTLLVFPTAALIYLCAIACLRRFPPARYFMVSWTALLAGILVYAAVSLGWLPKNPLTEYAIHIGSATEMVLLSFALAYRINVLTAERARSQLEAREELEQRVRERTADLDAALQRLEGANRRLEDFSRRDGLTGVFNRRSFDYILQRAEQQRREHGHPYALLMMDVDHFKLINDAHGHLVGDEALRHIALLIEPIVRAGGGQLARYGGEEFAAILGGSSLQQAAVVAKQICTAVAAHPLPLGESSHALSISVGVGFRDGGSSGEASDLVQQADAALYQAKQSGRNRVAIGV